MAEQGAYRIYSWKTANTDSAAEKKKAKSTEPEEPQRPSVQITSFHDWSEVGQWFRSLAAPRAAPTPQIRAKAYELTRNAKTDPERIQLIYDYVSTKFRYIGISLGIGRYQPHAAEDVLSNDYGDCKDKHTLFAALLAAENIKAHPALISSTSKIDLDVPSPSQFDHVITAVPRDGGFQAESYLRPAWNLTQDPVIAGHLQQVYEKQKKKHVVPRDPQTLQDLRTVKLGKLATKHTTAEFFLLFAPGPRVVGVKFISGSQELSEAGKKLADAKFQFSFPEDKDVQIVRRGILDCEPELPGCVFVLIPPSSVRSVK
jgi:hypothetical protein